MPIETLLLFFPWLGQTRFEIGGQAACLLTRELDLNLGKMVVLAPLIRHSLH